MGTTLLEYTPDADANRLVSEDPLALMVGMLLYQQIPVEKAFVGPHLLSERLGGALDAASIAAMDPDDLVAVFRERPAIHRFPANMATRVQALCAAVADGYGGDAGAVWRDVGTADELMERLASLPGFGEYKARIMIGVLGQRLGVRPRGWKKHLPDWPSIVDVGSFEDVAVLKERKKAWKAAGAGS